MRRLLAVLLASSTLVFAAGAAGLALAIAVATRLARRRPFLLAVAALVLATSRAQWSASQESR
jgi:hypothetical protein